MSDVAGGVFKHERIIDSIDAEDVLWILENDCDDDTRNAIGELSDDELRAIIDKASDAYACYVDSCALRSEFILGALWWFEGRRAVENG